VDLVQESRAMNVEGLVLLTADPVVARYSGPIRKV
jgi:hypothetical protein